MTEYRADLLEALTYIDPSALDYQEWLGIGMALKHESYPVDVWDDWSRQDTARYHSKECYKKWNTFHGTVHPVTAGTIIQMAKNNGWKPESGHELDWNDTIEKDDFAIIDPNWIESREISEPSDSLWSAVGDLVRYLGILFESTENVGYVTKSWENEDGKHLPTKGCWDRTAGQLIQELNKCSSDIGAVLGDYNPDVGAWIRFNPLDGKGCKNENITEFKYALVESDIIEVDKQNAIIRELELPVACLVHSGGKSLHAIVRIEAADYQEYRRRVDYLYNVCSRNGLKIDTQNRNPSRLSRMPGVIRKGRKQYLVAANIGKPTWNEWYEWIEDINDDLPEPEGLKNVWDSLPELSAPLIDGVLRQGHKMLMAGPSKSGKSFALIGLCCAIAEGRPWIGWGCTKGRVLYVNLELDRASCLHRFKDVYGALGWRPDCLSNIDIWNLRGKSLPMDKLAPKLIRRATKKNYIAIVIDPIYKVITGDENSADQMATFCNQFDKVCTELGCAVIYCHHHSKGSQGGKRSMDRASGSGVFARDPDALLDLIELELTEAARKQEENRAVCDACGEYLNGLYDNWEDDVSQDDMCSQVQMLAYCRKKLSIERYRMLDKKVEEAKGKVKSATAWRVEGTLREFPKFESVNLWFSYPIHKVDRIGTLKDIQPEDARQPWQKATDRRRKSADEERREKNLSLENAINASSFNGAPTINELSEYMGASDRTVRRRIQAHGGYVIDKGSGKVVPKK